MKPDHRRGRREESIYFEEEIQTCDATFLGIGKKMAEELGTSDRPETRLNWPAGMEGKVKIFLGRGLRRLRFLFSSVILGVGESLFVEWM